MLCWRAARRGVNWCLKASNSDLIVPMLQRGNAAPDAPRPYPQPAPSAPDRSHAPAWEPSPGRSASVSHRCGVFTSAFRPDGESGEMHGHFPRHPLGHPNCTALRVRCVARSAGDARKLGASHLRHRAHLLPGSPALLARADGDLGSVHPPPMLRWLGRAEFQLGHGVAR